LIDAAVPVSQAGFRKNRSCTEQVMALTSHIEAGFRQLDVRFAGTEIQHVEHPKYLGVTLDRSLTYNVAQKKAVKAMSGVSYRFHPYFSVLSKQFSRRKITIYI
jgi:hypothetical protein